MNVTFSEELKQWQEAYPLVQKANAILPEFVGEYAQEVSADWDKSTDENGKPVATLTLHGFDLKSVRELDLFDLQSQRRVYSGINLAWWELIHARNKRMVDAMKASWEE